MSTTTVRHRIFARLYPRISACADHHGGSEHRDEFLAGVNPKNLLLAAGAGSALAVVGPSGAEAAVALIVFVVVGSLTIIGPVVYRLAGGERATKGLDSAKGWLALHNDAVMTILFVVFGVDLIAKGIPPLS